MADLTALEQRALAELNAAESEEALRAWNTRYFGDQGEVKQALKEIANVPPADRPAYGKEINRTKDVLTKTHEAKLEQVKLKALDKSLAEAPLDVTLPGRPAPCGRLHLATRVMREICAIFADLGFQIYRSREVEDDEHN